MKRKFLKILFVSLFIAILGFIIFFINRDNDVTSDKRKMINVTFRLQWHIQTQFAGYYVALKKGYYKDAGLNVKIEQGGYGKNSLVTVKEGVEEFGTKWMSELTVAGEPLFSLANIVKDNGLVLISKKNRGINSIGKFRGKRVSIWFIGNEYQLFALLDKYKISKKELNIISQKWDMSQFYNDEVDVAAAMIYNEFLKVNSVGYTSEKLNIFSFKELGIGFPGQNIFTRKSYYKKNPKICKKFVEASIRGWQYAIDNPVEATKIVMEYDKENILKYQDQLLQMNEIIKLIQADKYPIGIHLKKNYELIQRIYVKDGIIKKKRNVNYYYTNEFVK